MTVKAFPSAPPNTYKSPDANGLARLMRLEQTLEATIAAYHYREELAQEIALAKAVSTVALLADSKDPGIAETVAQVVDQAYDTCLAALAGAYAGDDAALEAALSAVRAIRVSAMRRLPTQSKPPRAA